MYKWEMQILEQYPVEIVEMKKGRGNMYCFGTKEIYTLQKYEGQEQRAEFLRDVLRQLRAGGILVDELLKNKEGNCITTDRSGQRYILMTCIAGKECDPKNRDEVCRSVQTLAKIHRILRLYPGEIPAFIQKTDSLATQLKKQNQELKRGRNYILKRKEKQEFEQLFLQLYSQFYEQADKMQRQAQQLEEKEVQKQELCHGSFSHHTILFTPKGIRVTGFTSLKYGEQMTDLAFFLRKILEKQNWGVDMGKELLAAYSSVTPLTPLQMQQLQIILGYPQKYWKVLNRYLNSRKSWVNGRYLEKLQKIQKQEEIRKECCRKIFQS
ncbi:MAG: phosphotransferase [Lachnospiraceae bacterium]